MNLKIKATRSFIGIFFGMMVDAHTLHINLWQGMMKCVVIDTLLTECMFLEL